MRANRDKKPLRRIIGNALNLLLERGIYAVCSFVYIPYTVQAIGLEAFGYMLLVTTYVAVIMDLTNLVSWKMVLHYGTAPFHAGNRQQFYQVLRFGAQLDLLSAAAGYLVGLAGIALFSQHMGWPDELRPLAEVCMLAVFCDATGWCVGVTRLLDRFRYLTVANGIIALIRTLGCVIGYYAHYGLEYFMYLWLASSALVFCGDSLAALYALRQQGAGRPDWRSLFRSPELLRGAWRFTLMNSVNQVLFSVSRKLPTLLIGSYTGASEAAIFKVSTQITDGIVKPARALIPSLYPEFVHLKEEGRLDEIHRVIRKILLYVSGFSVVVIFVAVVFGDTLLHALLRTGGDGSQILPVLVGAALMNIISLPLEPFMIVTGRLGSVLRFRVLSILASLPLLAMLIYLYGGLGAAVALVITAAGTLAFFASQTRQAFALARSGPS